MDMQARENQYDVEANLAVLKLYVYFVHGLFQFTRNLDKIEMRIYSI